MTENRERLAKFQKLRDYFKNCLKITCWMESVRSWLLSGHVEALQSEAGEMNYGMEEKFLEFDDLVAAGEMLMEENDYLSELIKERNDELRSMLGWIRANWESQKNRCKHLHPLSEPFITEREERKIDEGTQDQNHKMMVMSQQQNVESVEHRSRHKDVITERVDLNPIQNQQHNEVISTEHKAHVWLYAQSDHRTKREQMPDTTSLNEQPSPNTGQVQQIDEVNQVQKQQYIFNIHKQRQKSPINNFSEKQLPITQINMTSSQDTRQSQHSLLIGEENNQTSSEHCYLESPDSNHDKDQHSDRNQVLVQPSPSNNQTQTQTGTARITNWMNSGLHLTDHLNDPHRLSQMEEATVDSTLLSALFLEASSSVVTSYSFTKTRSSSTLKQQMKRKERNQRSHTTLGLMTSDNSATVWSNVSRERCNTWSDGTSVAEVEVSLKRDSPDTPCTDVKNLRDDSHTSSDVSRRPIKNLCSYLSLGSTLSFSLPRDFRAFYSSAEDVLSSEEQEDPLSIPVSTDSDTTSFQFLPGNSGSDLDRNMIQGTSNHRTAPEDMVKLDPDVHESEELRHDRTQQRSQGMISSTFQQRYREKDQQQETESDTCDEGYSEFRGVFTVLDHTPPSSPPSCCPASSCTHKCLSVHTRIKDLNKHVYHPSRHTLSFPTNSLLLEIKDLSDQRPDSKLILNKSNRVMFCSERGCTVCWNDPEEKSPSAVTKGRDEVPQAPHWQFQEEEVELQEIWTRRVDAVICE